MPKTETYFEQISVEAVKKIAHTDLSTPRILFASRRIRGTPVPIERCKTDEWGRAVHEKCYVASVEKPRG
jgi:hypothetical protein